MEISQPLNFVDELHPLLNWSDIFPVFPEAKSYDTRNRFHFQNEKVK